MEKTSLHPILSAEDTQTLVADYLADPIFDNRRVLVLIPDHTRTAPLPVLFRAVSDVLTARVKVLNFMVAGDPPTVRRNRAAAIGRTNLA